MSSCFHFAFNKQVEMLYTVFYSIRKQQQNKQHYNYSSCVPGMDRKIHPECVVQHMW